MTIGPADESPSTGHATRVVEAAVTEAVSDSPRSTPDPQAARAPERHEALSTSTHHQHPASTQHDERDR